MTVKAQAVTYDDGSRMDDYTAGIVNIDPVDTPFTSNRKVVKMTNTVHEVYYDNLYLATSDHSVLEGATTGKYWSEAPTAAYAIAEIMRHAYMVTRHAYEAKRKSGVNPFARERWKGGKVIKNVWEDRAILGTQVSGATGTAPKMRGIVSLLSSYVYSTASAAFTESNINYFLTDAWARGAKVDELFMGIKQKRQMATFVGSETVVNADVSDKRIISKKDFYESDAAEMLKAFKSRVLTNFASAAGASAAARSLLFGVQGDMVKLGNFGGTTVDENKPDADYDSYRGKIQTTGTVILLHPGAGFVGVNYL